MDETRVTNIPEFSVSEISGAVKRTLEGAFGRVRVRGEVTELKRYPSGHIYFSLKDEGGKIAGVIWKSAVSRLGLEPENGVEVIAQGKISAYGDRSTYQLIVERMEYAGAGAAAGADQELAARARLCGRGDAVRHHPQARVSTAAAEVIGVLSTARARRGGSRTSAPRSSAASRAVSAVAKCGAGRKARGGENRRGNPRLRRIAA